MASVAWPAWLIDVVSLTKSTVAGLYQNDPYHVVRTTLGFLQTGNGMMARACCG